MKQVLRIPRVLLPREGFEKWAVIACDQFTSDRAYWQRVERSVGDAPSTLNFILPEAYLGEDDEARIAAVRENVYAALERDAVVKLNRGLVLTERATREGVRRGIVAAFDLEAYSCERGVLSPVRSSEAVVAERMPVRVQLRAASPLEFPHALIFYRDKKGKAVKGLLREELEKLYDFDLMEGGGHITGWFVPAYMAAETLAAMHAKGDPAFAVADGNHSVAAAKAHWENVKKTLTEEERASHPARFMLAEFINIYDPAVTFHAIHRLVKETDAEAFCDYFMRRVKCRREGNVLYPAFAASPEAIAETDALLEAFIRADGGRIDYIHGQKELVRCAAQEGCAGVVLPPIEKDDFFSFLKEGAALPKKSFSVGGGKENGTIWRAERSAMIKVCKFGGTSMADGNTMLRVKNIIESDAERRYVVVSAPGKRFGGDIKITDLLYETYESVKLAGKTGAAFEKVAERFRGIVHELGIGMDIERVLQETQAAILKEGTADFCASRGEYLSGRVMAALLDIPFIDARDVVKFTPEGRLDSTRTYALLAAALKGKPRAVVAGFYGEDAEGRVKTFSRGGSDISGAIVARAAGAELYENWTDVSGFLACDPRIVENPVPIRALSYKELRELSYMGANVLHSEAIFPVREADIPIRIKNTFRPEDEGTEIVPTSRHTYSGRRVTGVAGKKNFTVIFLEKSLLNAEIGFTYRVLAVFLKHGVSFEHIPTGIDTMSFVVDSADLKNGVLEEVCAEIRENVQPDNLRVITDIALIAVVGHGMARSVGTSARLFEAIARAGVNVRMIDQGSSELNIIVGVDNENYERTLKAVYEEFFE